MKKRGFRPIVLTLSLALLGAQAATVGGTVAERSSQPVEAAAVVGAGWKAFSVCLGCVMAGIVLLKTGTVVAAANVPGSAVALGGCIAACYSVLGL